MIFDFALQLDFRSAYGTDAEHMATILTEDLFYALSEAFKCASGDKCLNRSCKAAAMYPECMRAGVFKKLLAEIECQRYALLTGL